MKKKDILTNRKFVIGLIIIAGLVIAGISAFITISLISSRDFLEDDNKEFEDSIQNLMELYEIPSLAAGIVINESIIWSSGFGEQPHLETVYMIGSITKTFTATALLQLQEKNLLNLNTDINNYLPFNVRHPSLLDFPITPRMLLTHKSGLQTNLAWSLEYYFNNQTIDWINENLDLGGDILKWEHRPTLEEFLNGSLNPDGPYYDSYNWFSLPGTDFHYSNAGFQLLGYLVEQVSNQSLISYIEEYILDPLNMTSTGYDYTDFIDNHAFPYEWNNGNYKYPLYNLNTSGAGNLRSTVLDMIKYMISFMNQDGYNGIQLLKPETIETMFSTKVFFTGTSVEGFKYNGYGLGWFTFSHGYKGHGGATPGYSSTMWFKRTNQSSLGVILVFNRGSALIYDESLVNDFIPAINQIFLTRAEILFQKSLSN